MTAAAIGTMAPIMWQITKDGVREVNATPKGLDCLTWVVWSATDGMPTTVNVVDLAHTEELALAIWRKRPTSWWEL